MISTSCSLTNSYSRHLVNASCGTTAAMPAAIITRVGASRSAGGGGHTNSGTMPPRRTGVSRPPPNNRQNHGDNKDQGHSSLRGGIAAHRVSANTSTPAPPPRPAINIMLCDGLAAEQVCRVLTSPKRPRAAVNHAAPNVKAGLRLSSGEVAVSKVFGRR